MGWLSDFVSDPIGTVSSSASKLVSNPVGAVGGVLQGVTGGLGSLLSGVRGITGGLAGTVENATGLNLSNPATLAGLGLAAYGMYNPELFGGGITGAAGEGAAETGAADAAASSAPATWGSTLADTGAGQAGNLASSGTGLTMDGSLGLSASPSTYGGLSSDLGYGTGTTGLSAPTDGFFAGSTPTAATDPWSLSNMGATLSNGAKDVGSYIMNNKLQTAMIGSSLYDMYAKNQMAKQLQQQRQQQQDQINNFYAPGSPEYNQLMQESQRQAAAAGRPFSTSQFQADVAAKIANQKMQALQQSQTGSNQLLSAQMSNQYGGLNSLFNNLAMYQIMAKRGMI
jgi:hypothetical protein